MDVWEPALALGANSGSLDPEQDPDRLMLTLVTLLLSTPTTEPPVYRLFRYGLDSSRPLEGMGD